MPVILEKQNSRKMKMRFSPTAAAAVLLALVVAGPDGSQAAGPALKSPLSVAMTLKTPSVGASTTPDGRRFLVLARWDGSSGPQIVEWKSGELSAYPDSAWNAWAPGKDPALGFVHANAQRVGPEGDLWVVDVGAPGFGTKTLAHGPKLVEIDLSSNSVKRIYPLDGATMPESYVNDVRFNGRTAYLTDSGRPALIVLDLNSGGSRRVLEDAVSTRARRPLSGEGGVLRYPNGDPVFVHADQLEVSPDRKFLYFQSASGPLYRIETRLMDDPGVSAARLSAGVELFARTGGTAGTAIDAEGNIYASDTDKLRILKIAPTGRISTLVADPRLIWVDAMWIDDQGTLWMPATQLNRAAFVNGGKSRVDPPFRIYTLEIGHRPPVEDHP
jgi:sugar lactone lactonase YvrE